MRNNHKKNESDSPFMMYFIAVIMFFLLVFTILSMTHDKSSPLYVNFDKEIYDANVKIEQEVEINGEKVTKKIDKRFQQPDVIDKAIDKMGEEVKYNKYKSDYEEYYAQKQKSRQQEFERRQKLVQRLKEQEKRERLERLHKEKYALMQDTVKRQPAPQPQPQTAAPQNPESRIVSKAMQNSPCSPQSATAIAYFFHPNNTEPIELIFNNPNPAYKNGGKVKLVYGDLPRAKQHILKKNMVNLNQLLNNPQYKTKRTNEKKRPDAAFRVQSGVTTTCSPYVYQSKDFYLSSAQPSMENKYSKDTYCKNNHARLADPIELIPILLTGRLPAGLYWTSSHAYKMAPGKSVVTRSNLIPTQSAMLIDFGGDSLGFVSEDELGPNLRAISVCVFDE